MNRYLPPIILTGVGALLAACSPGDININPATTDSSNSSVNAACTTNCTSGGGTSGGANALCASYTQDGTTYQGIYDGTNCVYRTDFISNTRHLKVDMTIPALPSGGAHIFYGSLFVGETYRTQAELQAAGITQGGDGPTLTVEPGATIAFATKAQFLVINRGSQLIAVGEPDNPITFTSLTDINGKLPNPEAVSQWGGIVINGFGITNKCVYDGAVTYNADGSVASDTIALAPGSECSVDAEGSAGLDESQYGGDNNDDNSGDLEYVVVKHTGAEVANGDELNGISWGAVGRGTTVDHIQMYSVYDDGMEFFGGAVNINNYVSVYARDDSIDIDEGFSGTINNSLVIQSATDGNNCIEADGIGDFGNLTPTRIEEIIAQGINSRPKINHLTCIISPNGAATATHDPGAGWRLREGLFPTITNSLLISSFEPNDTGSSSDNYCVRIDDRVQQAAIEGDAVISHVIFSCQELVNSDTAWAFDGTTTPTQFLLTDSGNQNATVASGTAKDPTANADTDLQLLEGPLSIDSIDWATSLVDGAPPVATTDPTPDTYLCALSLGAEDWTAGWTYGIDPSNRGEPLWFE
jgi:hypothetical protein